MIILLLWLRGYQHMIAWVKSMGFCWTWGFHRLKLTILSVALVIAMMGRLICVWTSVSMTAADWLSQSDEKSLARCLARYGGTHVHASWRAIMRAQQQEPITTTRQLRDIVVRAVPPSATGKSPVGQVFQAIRIAVNDEVGVLQSVLPQCVQALAPGGRLAVISFHSLEDRL